MTVTEVVSLLDPYLLISGQLDVHLTVTEINWGRRQFDHANVVLRNVHVRPGTPPMVVAAPVEADAGRTGCDVRQSVARGPGQAISRRGRRRRCRPAALDPPARLGERRCRTRRSMWTRPRAVRGGARATARADRRRVGTGISRRRIDRVYPDRPDAAAARRSRSHRGGAVEHRASPAGGLRCCREWRTTAVRVSSRGM